MQRSVSRSLTPPVSTGVAFKDSFGSGFAFPSWDGSPFAGASIPAYAQAALYYYDFTARLAASNGVIFDMSETLFNRRNVPGQALDSNQQQVSFPANTPKITDTGLHIGSASSGNGPDYAEVYLPTGKEQLYGRLKGTIAAGTPIPLYGAPLFTLRESAHIRVGLITGLDDYEEVFSQFFVGNSSRSIGRLQDDWGSGDFELVFMVSHSLAKEAFNGGDFKDTDISPIYGAGHQLDRIGLGSNNGNFYTYANTPMDCTFTELMLFEGVPGAGVLEGLRTF